MIVFQEVIIIIKLVQWNGYLQNPKIQLGIYEISIMKLLFLQILYFLQKTLLQYILI